MTRPPLYVIIDWPRNTSTHLRTDGQGHTGPVFSVAWSPDGRKLASGSYDESIRVWDAGSGECVATLQVRGVRRVLDA